jgi:hypothetical protein
MYADASPQGYFPQPSYSTFEGWTSPIMPTMQQFSLVSDCVSLQASATGDQPQIHAVMG